MDQTKQFEIHHKQVTQKNYSLRKLTHCPPPVLQNVERCTVLQFNQVGLLSFGLQWSRLSGKQSRI